MRLFAVLTTLGFASSAGHAAGPQDILDGLAGHLLVGEYVSGAQFAERFHDDETTTFTSPDGTFGGLVRAQTGHLCFLYPAKNLLTAACFRVITRGENCYLFFATGNPTPETTRRAGFGWDARGWRDREPATCTGDLVT